MFPLQAVWGDSRSASRNDIFGSRGPERRQLTVMFCDLVGYTVLSQQFDPEDLQEIVQLFQQTAGKVIARYDGYISRYLGDAILVLFGYPAARENDAERAVHAALDLAKAVRALKVPSHDDVRLSVHTGIATGMVVAGNVIGEGASWEEAIVGKTPNLASRLQGLAHPNAVVISEDTHKLLRDAFEYRYLGTHALKGFETPVKAWRVVGPSAVETRFDAAHTARLTPLVNRRDEIDRMRRLWDEAKCRAGQVLLLCGEPGIGKSRLTKALRHHVADEPHISLQYQCSPYYRYTALYPFAQQLERAAGFGREDSDPVRVDKLRALLGAELLPVFARLMSIRMERGANAAELSPQRQKDLSFAAISKRLLALAQDRPVLVTVEDVHWMDPTSRELMTYILDRMGDARVFFVVTFRPEFLPPWTGRPNVSTMTLGGLSPSDGETLAKNVAGGRRVSQEVIARVVGKTDGVPLFIEELTKSLFDVGILSVNADGSLVPDPLSLDAIPVTLMDSLMARIDQLGEAKEIAQIGAVIGQEFTLSLLESVTLESAAKLETALERLVSSGLAMRHDQATEARYVFKHALVCDAAYKSLLRKRRKKLHARIAECLESDFPETVANEPELLAHHCSRAGCTEKAIRYWHVAGQRASERSANIEAARHLNKALGVLDDLPDPATRRDLELSLLITLGPVEIAIKGSGSRTASDAYARAVELCADSPDSPLHFAAYWGQWRTSKSYLTKRERADKLSAVAKNLADPGLRLQAHHCQWASLFNLGFHRRCCQHVDRGLRLYESGDFRWHASMYGGHDPAVCGHGEAALALWLLGCPAQALTRVNRALAIAEKLSHNGSTAHAMDIALMLHRYRQDVPEVSMRAEQMIALSIHEDFAAHRAKGEMFRGWARCRLGEVERGILELNKGLEALRALATNEDLPVFLDMLAECCALGGRPHEGLSALEVAFAEAEDAALRYWLAELLRRKGELLLKAGAEHDGRAETCFDDALRIARQQEARSLELRTATSYSRLLRRRGETGAAHDLLSRVYDWFTEGFDTVDLAMAKACLDELEPNRSPSREGP